MIILDMEMNEEMMMENVIESMDWDNIDEEDVFENGVVVVEDVSEEEGDDSGVVVYSYKGKYVFMSFDIGGSLGGVEVYDILYYGGE